MTIQAYTATPKKERRFLLIFSKLLGKSSCGSHVNYFPIQVWYYKYINIVKSLVVKKAHDHFHQLQLTENKSEHQFCYYK